ncbi:MGDG synthase family glycosyltransferase [Leptospirillum ferriphilum]|jgi:processive 1,2-diacylglycerol beta-glucosyltransferase|uniref:Monogalactosyldiacylglycerol synthase n=2 Tax=Leptospirillum TaxID=179 RepID=A0A094YNN7_9BACT|nr:glycosyltransferase [Leptospirillum ferriphilum]EDZ39754.1 MAG: Putative monogalactosyldiacylglycerol synthase [Leptospirillum sp. Group II '5-way CG']KGA94861.1 Monogalactosyldiacylglycerol synthase [Leptospirillum ferriphilum]
MIALFHATAGQGHQKAAEAVHKALLIQEYPCPQPVDTLELLRPGFRRLYRDGYHYLARKNRRLLEFLYRTTDHPGQGGFLHSSRLKIQKRLAPGFAPALQFRQPDVIVCTHFLPLELLWEKRSRPFSRSVIVAVLTDLFPHGLWIHPHVDHYVVPTEDARQELAGMGVPAERIHLLGIPVDPHFSRKKPTREARRNLGLPEKPTVLVLSGGFGTAPLCHVLDSFRDVKKDISLVLVAGRNERLRNALEARKNDFPFSVRVLGFTDNLSEWMDASDIVLTKPGGLTTSETLSKAIPMILLPPQGGQEKRNRDYLLFRHAAIPADAEGAGKTAVHLLENPEKCQTLIRSCRRLARPHAAESISAFLIDLDQRLTRSLP